MSCLDALVSDPLILAPEETVAHALRRVETRGVRVAPVVDSGKRLLGLFGLRTVMKDLLPVAAQMKDGIPDLGFVVGGDQGAAKRIRKIANSLVREHLETEMDELVLRPDTEMLEVIHRLALHGSPLPVVEEGTGRFVGLVSEQSCLTRLHEVLREVELAEAREAGAAGQA